jgi:hypothetical protein
MSDKAQLEMPLRHAGAVSHWLACGPILSPLDHLDDTIDPSGPAFGPGKRWILSYWAFHPASRALKSRIYQQLPGPSIPAAPPRPGQAGPDGQRWRYAAVEEDQVVDFSVFNFAPSWMQGWLYARLKCEQRLTLQAELITIGPARVWLDGAELAHPTEFSYVEPIVVPLRFTLPAGLHDLYLHGDMIGWREARLALGLRFLNDPPIQTCIPLGDHSAFQWFQAEKTLSYVQLRRFVVVDHPGELRLSPDAPNPVTLQVEACAVQPEFILPEAAPLKLPCGQSVVTLQPGERAELTVSDELAASVTHLPDGHSIDLVLRPLDGLTINVKRRVWVNRSPYSEYPYGSYEDRRREALEHLADIRYDVVGSMAAVTIGQSDMIDSEAVKLACHYLEKRYDCADFFALSLLALLYRFGDHPALQPGDRDRIEQALRHFKFWLDEPGLDGMCYITENHQILFHVTGYLTGQRWPEQVFANSGFTGRQQMERARTRLENWILRRLRGGFSEWDSNTYLTMDVFAMLALVEFARSARLREMATALLHKTIFMIASQSYRGAHGSTHGRCYVEGLKTARADATSGLQRIAWGMGNFNGEVRATGLLALAQRYRVPELLQGIGGQLPPLLVTHARSRGRYRPQFDIHRGEWDVRTITRRTPDGMLSAAIDYRPGQRGIQEHLWQATLSPEAVVFTNYPGNSQEHGNARPNFWAGSVRLPRIGMFDRTVICLYALEPTVGLGFSHAYFPCVAFDDYVIEERWAFARRGSGYVALWSDGELNLTDSGRHAGQELRSRAGGRVWMCSAGSAAEDGDWASFCSKIRRQPPVLNSHRIQCQTPGGDTLNFDWEGPMLVNGKPIDWANFPHYDNLYTHVPFDSDHMTIRKDDNTLSLDLKNGGTKHS